MRPMRSRSPRISPLQVIFTSFPDAIRYLGGHMSRVRDVSNPDGDRRDQLSVRLRQALVGLISAELARADQHEADRHLRFTARRAAPAGADTGGEDIDLDLPAFFDDEGNQGGDETAPPGPRQIVPRLRTADISLIEVTDDSIVRTRLFPRTVHCQQCGHFLLLDPEQPPASLACTCCHRGQFIIEPIIFICARCVVTRELIPPAEQTQGGRVRRRRRSEDCTGLPLLCPDCTAGHIHLQKHGTNAISRWQWTCTACGHYRENVQEPCRMCGLPRTATDRSDYVFMQAIPAAAANALQPLVHQQMFVGDQEIDLTVLRAEAARQAGDWTDTFSLDQAVASGARTAEDLERLRDSCLHNAYLVNNVRAFTTTYGYRAGDVACHPLTPIAAGERFARFFPDPEGLTRFLAYCVSAEGAALVLEFDPVRVMERLTVLDPTLAGTSLTQAITTEATDIGRQEIRSLLRAENQRLLVYRALHAVEHAVLSSAMRQIGSESLGSRLFPTTGTIVIFEKAEIGRGGVVQLVNRGLGLLMLFDAARDSMLGCAQGCQDGCPACVYLKEPYCNQPSVELGQVWLPSNSLLSRRGAAQILAIQVLP